jgi:DNA-binding LacI/PurR family transcriptional regulator
MPVTIKDVAQVAGVSHPTVSRALRGDKRVTPETVNRIRQIAQELGYVPSAAARSLKTNRTRVIGILVHRVSDPFYSEVIDGIEDVLQAEGYSIFLASSDNDRAREAKIFRAMTERRVDGLIVCSMYITNEDRRNMNLHAAPLVLIHNRAEEITPFTIYHDDRYGAREMTRHLLDLGHTRIAFIGNERAGRSSNERRAGYLEAMRAANLEPDPAWITQAAFAQPQAAAAPVNALLALAKPPTALVCFDDLLAIGVMQVLYNARRHIPRDISVTGFDNIVLAEYMNPPLTTFNQPKYSLGAQAAQMLLDSMRAAAPTDPASTVLTLRGEIITRASTAPPSTLV